MTQAEALLTVADIILCRREKPIVVCEGVSDSQLATIALAIKLRRSNPQIPFRAMVEEWSRGRIIEELY